MKILILIHSMAAGGAERVASNLANEWIAFGHKVIIVTQQPQSVDFYQLNPGVSRVALDMAIDSGGILKALGNNFKRVLVLHRVIKGHKPNVVIGIMTTANVLAPLATLGMRIPVIACERTYPPQLPVGRVWSRLRRWTYPLAARVLMLTSEGVDWLRREIPHARGVVIPNPVSYPLPVNTPELLPSTVLQPERKVVLAVGRMSEEKGFAGLIAVFASLVEDHPQWDLVILGDGPLRPSLAQQVEAAGLSRRVFMPGRAGNVGAWYERADLYVMSSRVEGFPNTLGEAMAHGCAVVSFDCDTGPRDLIRHEMDGLLVPPGDSPALAQSLGRLMQDDALRALMGERAVDVRRRYSMERVLGLWDELFSDVFHERKS